MKTTLHLVLVLLSLSFMTSLMCNAQKKDSEFKLTKYNKSMENRADDGITSTVHEKYVRQLVFSTSPFQKGADNENDFKKEFTPGDYIYIRAYMPHSVYNHPVFAFQKGGESPKENIYGDYYFKMTIDGAPLLSENYQFGKGSVDLKDEGSTVLSSVFLPDASIKERDLYLLKALNELSEGDHTIRLELHTSSGGYDSREPICTGEFVYKKTGTENLAVGKTWSQYTAAAQDEKLEAQMLEIMKEIAVKEEWDAEIGGVKIDDKVWSIERNEFTGIILNRSIGALVYIKYNNGECKVRRFLFQQDHDGSNYSDYLYHNGYGGKYEKVDCE